MNTIDLSRWKIKLPVFQPEECTDNSIDQEYTACARKGFYRYGMRRGFESESYAIQWGVAYHKYREVVEQVMFAENCTMNDEVHAIGVEACLKGWKQPDLSDKKSYLDTVRLAKAVNQAKDRIIEEQTTGRITVTRPEEPFDLELPFWICRNCGQADRDNNISDPELCLGCGKKGLYRVRHGGRVDQFIKFLGKDMIRDFKTTGYKTDYYNEKFDPNSQLMGYVWAGEQLSGRKFDGVLIETIYNTKTKGPEVSQHIINYSKGQIEQWLASKMMKRSLIQVMWSRTDELGYLAFPQNTNHCNEYGGCRFRGACRTGSAWELEQWLENETIVSTWDFMNPEAEEGGPA